MPFLQYRSIGFNQMKELMVLQVLVQLVLTKCLEP